MCISKFSLSQPPSVSVSSRRHGLHPSEPPHLLDHCHYDHLNILSIVVTRCFCNVNQVLFAARLTISIYIDRCKSIMYDMWLYSKSSCDCNKDGYDSWNGMLFWNPETQCCENMSPSLKFHTELRRGFIYYSQCFPQPCAEGPSCIQSLPLTHADVPAGPIW